MDDEYCLDEDPLWSDWGEGEDFDLEGSSFSLPGPKRTTPLEGLSNVDYSLNSPIIRDEVEEFQKYYFGDPYRESWNKKLWRERKEVFRQVGISRGQMGSVDLFHKRFFSFLLHADINTENFKSVLNLTQSDQKKTWEIPKAFFKRWLDQTINPRDKSAVTEETLRYGAIWMHFHIATIIMNATSKIEKENLIRQFKLTKVSADGAEGVRYFSGELGYITIVRGMAHISRIRSIVDRNMLLLMKDIVNSRVQSLLSMQNRLDNKFTNQDILVMEKIYRTGDSMIVRNGNLAYDGLKLIEPICNLRMTELAQKERPKIPLFTEFKAHILSSIGDDPQNQLELEELFREIVNINNPDLVLSIYGAFRHWGHPFLDYIEGLKKLHQQTTMKKIVDEEYAGKLASDLAYLVLKDQFNKTKRWSLDIDKIPNSHPLHDSFVSNTWPTPFQIKDYGDKWHLLPLAKCFEIPDVIDPSLIYADKSHSYTFSELKDHITRHPNIPVPSHKVLKSFLEKPATDWKKFLEQINDHGLDIEDLVIGLRGKEREIKRIGRFFSLMSWKLRDYFVITEYLIKIHYVPLFSGLTMADDLNTVMKKMLDTSNGQGLKNYDYITIANHIDYEKWNNHQRGEANNPVFKVMGQFLGYPNLITRTHEFFEKSLIYYNNRTDLMTIENGDIVNKDPLQLVCWRGQKGGLEGLRQKGWSIVNLLVIRREGKVENTKISILAQGDNQVICTQYKLQKVRTEDELTVCINGIIGNNNTIMNNIEIGTRKLGLIINQNETMKSADYLNYGKIPIFRGTLKGLDTKRWSRVTCVSNDQLPTMSNILSTVSSNALSVGYFSDSIIEPIAHYNFIGNFVLRLMEVHNPATRNTLEGILTKDEQRLLRHTHYRILMLYLDPSLGGISGMSLTRFLIRAFPDPVTESLSFWKGVYHETSAPIQTLISEIGQPDLVPYSSEHFPKLIENPLALNLRHNPNPIQRIKEEIMKYLINRCDTISNHIIQHAIKHTRDEELRLYSFLESIKPLFPRFISEYKSATYLGLTESLVSLFQNAKTIRNIFSRFIQLELETIIEAAETGGIKSILKKVKRSLSGSPHIWSCSSTLADMLRRISWNGKVIGATVPHPFEMIPVPTRMRYCCDPTPNTAIKRACVSVLVPKGIPNVNGAKGPYKAYLGSRTMESTSLLRPWENEPKVPLIKRASDLRKAFNWFVDPQSNLGLSITNNLNALTGEEWGEGLIGARRTGSALHRFSCSRQSQGGYIAQSPLFGTWLIETTDSMESLGETNYDFLFQGLLIYAQTTTGERQKGKEQSCFFHYHIDCTECLREIQEVYLNTELKYLHPNVSDILNSWKPDGAPWLEKRTSIELKEGPWFPKSSDEQSFHIGKLQGFLFGYLSQRAGGNMNSDRSLFPLVLSRKLKPYSYMVGLLQGLIMSASIIALYKRSIQHLKRPVPLLLGQVLYLIERLSQHEGLINIWRSEKFLLEFIKIPHKIPSSYPLTNRDLGLLGRNFLKSLFTRYEELKSCLPKYAQEVWIFGDTVDPDLIISLILSHEASEILYQHKLQKKDLPTLRGIKNILSDPSQKMTKTEILTKLRIAQVFKVDSEVRHAMRNTPDYSLDMQEMEAPIKEKWGREYSGFVMELVVPYTTVPTVYDMKIIVPSIRDPLISGMRLFQCPTGAHYKVRSILEHHKINFMDALAGGDGSGGIGSMLLRINPTARLIFNSLLELNGVELKGSSPSPPSAISSIPHIKSRCVNFNDVWKNPSDLSRQETWNYFLDLKQVHSLSLDLVILDMNIIDDENIEKIERRTEQNITKLLSSRGALIFKTYIGRLLDHWSTGILERIGSLFAEVSLNVPLLATSHTSEVYVVFKSPSPDYTNCHPDVKKVIKHIKSFPSLRDPEDEFQRALSIPLDQMFKGVPAERQSDPCIDISVLLLNLGVETGMAGLIGEILRLSTLKERRHLPFFVLILSTNSILELTREESDGSLKLYPDGTVYNIGSWIVGFLNWYALSTKDWKIKRTAQDLIDKIFPFSWSIVRTGKRRYTKRVSFTNQYQHKKNMYLDEYIGKISAIIRVLLRLFPLNHHYSQQSKEIDTLLQRCNRSLSVELFHNRTDFQNLLSGWMVDVSNISPHLSVYQLKGRESTWVD